MTLQQHHAGRPSRLVSLAELSPELLAAAVEGVGGTPSRGRCRRCLMWQLRYRVAIHTAQYIAVHVRLPELQDAIVDHISVSWVRHVAAGSHRRGFGDFLAEYCLRVERQVVPELPATSGHLAEYRRVWTVHATSLCGAPAPASANQDCQSIPRADSQTRSNESR